MEQETPTTPSRVLLIDLDNCPQEIGKLPQTLAEFSRIIVCYGGVEPKVPLGLVTALATAIHESKLDLVGMDKGGKNAADFGLAFWAGRLVAEMPEETRFTVLSADTDLDHVVNMLRHTGRKAERLNGQRRSGKGSGGGGNGAKGLDVDKAVDDFVAMFLLPGKPRPAKRATLLNSIKTAFKTGKWKGVASDTVLTTLQERGLLKFDSKGKVVYLLDEDFDDVHEPLTGDDEDGDIPF